VVAAVCCGAAESLFRYAELEPPQSVPLVAGAVCSVLALERRSENQKPHTSLKPQEAAWPRRAAPLIMHSRRSGPPLAPRSPSRVPRGWQGHCGKATWALLVAFSGNFRLFDTRCHQCILQLMLCMLALFPIAWDAGPIQSGLEKIGEASGCGIRLRVGLRRQTPRPSRVSPRIVAQACLSRWQNLGDHG
jgi:hypothetical protein